MYGPCQHITFLFANLVMFIEVNAAQSRSYIQHGTLVETSDTPYVCIDYYAVATVPMFISKHHALYTMFDALICM